MAKLSSPVNQLQKNGLRGQVDFCYWKGIPYARAWPRKSNLNPTDDQLYYRDLMKYANARCKAQPELQRIAWRLFAHAPSRTWVDYLKKATFELDRTDDNQEMPYFDGMSAQYSFSTPTLEIKTSWNPAQQPSLEPFQLYTRPAATDEYAVTWNYTGMSEADGRKIVRYYEPDLHGFEPVEPTTFDATAGEALFQLDCSEVSGFFVGGQKLSQENQRFTQTPVYYLSPVIDFTIDPETQLSLDPPEDPRFYLAQGGRWKINYIDGLWLTSLWQEPDRQYNRFDLDYFAHRQLIAFSMMVSNNRNRNQLLPGQSTAGFEDRDDLLANLQFWSGDYDFQPGAIYLWYQDNYPADNSGIGHWRMRRNFVEQRQVLPDII